MVNKWKGTFEIWNNPKFANIYAKEMGRRFIKFSDKIVYISRNLFLKNTILYSYNCCNDLSDLIKLSKILKVGFIQHYTLDMLDLPYRSFEILHTVIIDLEMAEHKLWRQIGKKTRNMVRRGMKENIKIKVAESDEDFFEWWKIYMKVAKRKKFPTQPLTLVYNLFSDSTLSKLVVSLKNSKIIGGMFFLVNEYPMYWLGAFDIEGRKFHASNLNMWDAILYFKNEGYKIIDLGGIRLGANHGPSRFKLSFNGQIVKAFRYVIPIQKEKALLLVFAGKIKEII